MLHAKVERWEDALGEMLGLFPLHWKEVASPVPLDMHFSTYRKLAENGTLLLVGLRDGAKLVGYWTLIITPFLHSQSVRAAQTDLLFIHPEARGGGQGFSLLWKVAKEALLARKVGLWFVGEKLVKPLGPLLQKYGFTPHEMAYICELGEE